MRVPAFEDLSKEQDLIYSLPLDGNYLVSGPPGTGKSIMAIYRAQVLAFDEREPTVLMYNNVLQQYTAQAADSLGVPGAVSTFHSWTQRFWIEHFNEPAPTEPGHPYVHDWAAMTHRFFASPPGAETLTDLLVDEGQDLPLEFFRLAPFFTRNITVFADENQQLTARNTTLDEIAAAIRFDDRLELRQNYRNTAQIAAVAARFYCGTPTGIPELPTRQGEKPTLRRHDSEIEVAEFVARYVKANPNRTVGIACENTGMQYRIFRVLSRRKLALPVQMYVSGDKQNKVLRFDEPAVTIVNFRSLKGLEFDTLFVPELQQLSADPTSASTRMMFYVAVSRARDELHLSYSGDGRLPPILDGLTGLVREL